MLFYNVAEDVNQAFSRGVELLLEHGVTDNSRNGSVLRLPAPMITVYKNPTKRVLTNYVRRPNPFFHLMESLWMLAGRNDIKFVSYFNARMAEYSDNTTTQPAAYGYRWVKHFNKNQIDFVINELNKNSNSRRAVISMWDPNTDIDAVQNSGADVPCNTTMFFLKRPDGRLDMTVTNRSNDAVWGCFGANVVHMSMLHEFIALSVDLPIGTYTQISNDFHVYTDVFSNNKLQAMLKVTPDHYISNPMALFDKDSIGDFSLDLGTFFNNYDKEIFEDSFYSPYFINIVEPMFSAWKSYKVRNKLAAFEALETMPTCDWSIAASAWLTGVNW